jgi:N-acetylglucosamine kinase-like BadF-type ATPase
MSSRPRFLLGVDAGGTKTEAVLATLDGAAVAESRTGGANHERLGWEGAREALRTATITVLARAAAAPTDVVASAWGLAGLDWPQDERHYRGIVDSLGLAGPDVLMNDAWLALEVPAGGGVSTGTARDAVAVAAGTGLVAVGRGADGRTARTLGVGAGHGEWGSGGDIVRAAAEAVAQQFLGLGPPTALTALVLERSGTSDLHEYLRRVWRLGRPGLLPPDVWDTAAAGDDAAVAIGERAADSYAAAVGAVSGRIGSAEPEVVLSGRVLDPGHPYLHSRVLAALSRRVPGCRARRLGVAPVHGAVHAARRLALGMEPTAGSFAGGHD